MKAREMYCEVVVVYREAVRIPRCRRLAFWRPLALFLLMSSVVTPAGAASLQATSAGQMTNYAQQGEPTQDDLFAMVAQQVPAFGGMYVDEDTQTLYVWLTDQGQSLAAAVQALQSTFGSQILNEFTPVALPAQYGFTQLKAWSDQMVALSTPGIAFTDIDDGNNRLAIGVENLATQGPAVEAELVDLGIPLQVVSIEQSEGYTDLLPLTREGPEILVWIAIGLVSVVIVSAWFSAARKKRRFIRTKPLSS